MELQVVGGTRVRVKTQWTIVQAEGTSLTALDAPRPQAPVVPGVVLFVPDDVMRRPVYMFVNYIHGRRVRVSTSGRVEVHTDICV